MIRREAWLLEIRAFLGERSPQGLDEESFPYLRTRGGFPRQEENHPVIEDLDAWDRVSGKEDPALDSGGVEEAGDIYERHQSESAFKDMWRHLTGPDSTKYEKALRNFAESGDSLQWALPSGISSLSPSEIQHLLRALEIHKAQKQKYYPNK